MESKPPLSEMHMEGRVMYRLNKTDRYLENMRAAEPRKYEQLMETVRKQRRNMKKMYTEKKQSTEANKARLMEAKKMQHDIKQAKAQETDDQIKRVVGEVGKFQTPSEVDDYIASCSTKKKQLEIIKAQMQHLKKEDVHELEKLSNDQKLMTISKKTPEVLKEDLKVFVKFIQSSGSQSQEASTSRDQLKASWDEFDHDSDSGSESKDHEEDDPLPPLKKQKTGESSSDLKSREIVAVA